MSLRTLATAQVANAFTIADSLLESIKYKYSDVPDYDPDTGEVIESSDSVTVKVLLETEGLKELVDQTGISLKSFSGALKCTVQASDLTRAAKTGDYFFRDDVRYNVIALVTDPLEIVYTLLVVRI